MSACASLPSAIVTVGDDHRARAARPAPRTPPPTPTCCRSTRTPRPWRRSSTAFEMATVMPRSLNEPVGLAPSTFSSTRARRPAPTRRGASSSGVLPSSSVTTGVASVTGQAVAVRLDDPGPRRGTAALDARLIPRLRRPAGPSRRGATASSVAHLADRGAQVGLPRARCVTKMRRASSPLPFCCIDWIDTSCSPNTPGDRGEHAGPVGHVEREVELRLDVVDRRGSASRRARRSWRPAPLDAGSWPRR